METSCWEGVLARGDRRLVPVIQKGYEKGFIFDAWDDSFKYDEWAEILEKEGLNRDMYAREIGVDEVLPWDHISVGVTKEFFRKEKERAYQETVTPNCREKCSNCGAACFKTGVCYERR